MLLYVCIFIIIALASIYQIKKNKKYSSLIGYIIFILLLVFGGCRFEVGSDWDGYKDIYERTYDGLNTNIEFGFVFILRGFSKITSNYIWFSFFIFFISLFLKFVTLKKYSLYPVLSLLLYFSSIFLSSDLNQIRQGLSLGICFYSFIYLFANKKTSFYILIFIAILIHYSSIVFLPALWFSKLNFSKRHYYAIIALGLINFFFFRVTLFSILNLDSLALLGENMTNKYAIYLQDDYGFQTSFTVFVRVLLFIFFVSRFGKPNYLHNNNKVLLNVYFASIIVYFFISTQPLIAARLSSYYKTAELILLPSLIPSDGNLYKKLFIFSLIVLYALLIFYRTFQIPDNGLVPYKSILF